MKNYMQYGNDNAFNNKQREQVNTALFVCCIFYFLCFCFFVFLFFVLQTAKQTPVAIMIPNPMNPYFHLPSSPVIGILNVALLVISYKHS